MLTFTHNDIKNETDSGSFQRGLAYFKNGMVEHLKIIQARKNAVILYSEVEGSSYDLYEQNISINQEYGVTDIDGDCTCPVGFNCKHVAASCLQYLSMNNAALVSTIATADEITQQANEQVDSSLSWLDEFVAVGESTTSYASVSSDEFISYALTPVNIGIGLTVKPLKNRYLKKGGLGKGRLVSLYNLCNSYALYDSLQDIDREIAEMLAAQNDDGWRVGELNISGEIGSLVLNKIIETGRCHWLNPQNPVITMAEPRDLQLNWIDTGDGRQRLDISVRPDCLILKCQPAMYVDCESYEIGEIKGADFNLKQWKMLLDMPLIPAASCAQFSQKLLLSCPDTKLPPPQKIDIIQIKEPAVPSLFLYGDVNADTGYRAHFMRLRFHYGDYEIRTSPGSTVVNLLEDDKAVTVHRDLMAEQAALEQLKNEGFQTMPGEYQGDVIFAAISSLSHKTSADRWQDFLQQKLPELESQGWLIEKDSSFQIEFLQVDNWDVEIESDNDWFDLRFDLEVAGKKIPLLPLIAEVLHAYDLNNLPETISLPLGDSKYLQIPVERIRPIFQTLYELFDTQSISEDGKLRLSRFDATRLAELEENNELNWTGGEAMRQLGRKLKNFKGIKRVAPPRGLKANLRDYQQQGLNWLGFLREYKFNGILADDMGLGKTVQTLTHLLKEKEAKRKDKPCLILAPTSLMSNWRREAELFTPKLKVLILQGAERKQHFDKINQYDLILSTYPLLVRDQETLLAYEYYYLILDEAQVIKNPLAKAARMARKINCQHRLCLTGTPMENHLGELWALFDFLMPGCLGDQKSFNLHYRNPIEKQGDDEQRQRLVRRITPFMLRRSKSEVVKELPEKTEIIRATTFDKQQAALYESIRLSMQKKVRDAIKQKGLARSHITILDALLKLRQTCCDPKLLSLTQAKKVKSSAKLEMLMEMLPEMLEEGRRILLFSQFTKMLAIIEQELKNKKISYTKLTGQTTKRDEVIEQFKRGEANVFLISLKAGGVGLNLTEADTVIHYDPWWNPAVERQATDRAHRIGQNKAVFVYKLIVENTLEEKIMDMQERKQALADGVYSKAGSGKNLKLTADDLQELFAPLST